MEHIIGFVAAFLTTASMLPQLIKVVRTKDTKSLSLTMLTVLCIGISLWLIYGIMLSSLPLILANSISLCLVGPVAMLKVKYG